jgi:hypothetical protein
VALQLLPLPRPFITSALNRATRISRTPREETMPDAKQLCQRSSTLRDHHHSASVCDEVAEQDGDRAMLTLRTDARRPAGR